MTRYCNCMTSEGTHKVLYRTREIALKKALRLEARGLLDFNTPLSVYICPTRGEWHVTTKPQKKNVQSWGQINDLTYFRRQVGRYLMSQLADSPWRDDPQLKRRKSLAALGDLGFFVADFGFDRPATGKAERWEWIGGFLDSQAALELLTEMADVVGFNLSTTDHWATRADQSKLNPRIRKALDGMTSVTISNPEHGQGLLVMNCVRALDGTFDPDMARHLMLERQDANLVGDSR